MIGVKYKSIDLNNVRELKHERIRRIKAQLRENIRTSMCPSRLEGRLLIPYNKEYFK